MIKKVKLVGLVIVIIFLISGVGSVSLINSQESSNILKTPKKSAQQFDDDILETMYQNIDFEFSTVFYDDANYRNEYTSAYLETESTYLTDVGYNDSISGVVNNFTEYAENDDITIAYGILDSIGTLDIKDADSTDIDSTEGGFYNATYSFTDDANGANPAGWSVQEVDSYVGVIQSIEGHKKVLKIAITGVGAWPYVYNSFPDQTSDITIEWWHRSDNFGTKTEFRIEDDDNNLFYAEFGGVGADYFAWNIGVQTVVYNNPAINTWYRHKVIMDISESTFDYYIYSSAGVQLGFANDFGFRQAYVDGIDRLYIWSKYLVGIKAEHFDAIDYSWTPGYVEDRIAECDDATVDLTVLIDGLNPHLSLEALEFELYSYYKTNESVNTKFYIYNFTNTG